MKTIRTLIYLLAACWLCHGRLLAQNLPITIEAESGTIGADFSVLSDGTVGYVTINGTVGGQNPSTSNRVISYSVTFPSAGTYQLYARILVGANTFNDDSMYYGNGFGTKSPTSDNDWITANGLAPVGYTTSTDTVTGAGSAQNLVWKWIKLSEFDGGEGPINFVVPANQLTQTFQIGAREDGLEIDKFVFAPVGFFYTVANLDNGQAGSTTPPPPPFTPTGPPIAQGQDKFLGSVSSATQNVNFTHYWNQVTPENGGKWGSVEATRDVWNWTDLDTAYNLAKTNGYPFKMHNLIWGSQQPAWLETLSAADQLTAIEEWFSAVAARYPDIDYIDVVNEPLHTPPSGPGTGNYLNALGGAGASGWDWIINAYQLARLHFPHAKLLINEYSVTNDGNEAAQYIKIIQLLQAQNLIDGIGIQEHAFETRVDASVIAGNLNTIAATGVPIYISEMDIDGPTDDVQLQDYQRIFPIFWENPAVRGITLWGYVPGMWRTAEGAYLALSNGAERPALVWLRAYVNDHRPLVNVGQSFGVVAGSSDNTAIGSLTATDADSGTMFQGWQITGGTGAGIFTINAATGQIVLTNHLLLTAASYTLVVTVSDGLRTSLSETVTIHVTPSPLSITRSGYSLNRRTNTIVQTITVTNHSASTLAGPIYYVLDSLSTNTSLVNGKGVSVNTTGPSSPYIIVSSTDLAPGASVSIALQFANPASGGITYTARALNGASP